MPDQMTNTKSLTQQTDENNKQQQKETKQKGKTTKGRAGKKSDGERTNFASIFRDGAKAKFVRKVLCGVMQRPPAVLP